MSLSTDEPPARSQRVITDLAEAVEHFPATGIAQQIHGHDHVNRAGRLKLRHIPVQIATAQGVPLLFFFGQLNHRRRDIDARDLRGPSLFDQARVESLATGDIQHRLAANIAQQIEQGVALDIFPKRKLF